MVGGEIYVKKIPSMKIVDIASCISPNAKHEIIGIRPGEKLHEEMITETDSLYTVELDKYYVITPTTPTWKTSDFIEKFKGKMVEPGFKYNSGTNTDFLTVDAIRNEIKKHVDNNFSV